MNWYLGVLKNYAKFDGRARRKEYWMFFLFNLIIGAVLAILDSVLFGGGAGLLLILYMLAVIVPGVAVSVRRLHDTDRSGWWILVSLVPFVGAIVLLIFMILDGTPGENRFGPNPKGA